jgi:IclR family acetate operon transcriptional repressor
MTSKTVNLRNQNEPGREQESSHRAAISSTVAKALSIVDILASKAETGVSLAELSALLKMPKSTTHRYLATLLKLGLAERNSTDRFYLGTKVIELAGSFLAKSDLRNESQQILTELAEKTLETIHLAVPSGIEVVYIAKVESRHPWGMFSYIGARLPMHSTALGKVILAFNADELFRKVLTELPKSRTPNTITSPQALETELALVRSRGFAIDDEENEVGICCVGAPIIDYTGKAIAAISVSGPRERMDRERCIQMGPLVHETAQRISKRRGFVGNLTNGPT